METHAPHALVRANVLHEARVANLDLYVSNYVREIRVPLEQIEDVTENWWVNIRPVTVRFRRETDFGPSITFMPTTRWWGFWSAHPVLGEIEMAIRRVRGLPPERPAA